MLNRARHRTRLRRREWGLLSALLLALVAWLSLPGSLDRINYLIQDAGMKLPARPGHPDVVLVAIDDRSVEAVGRWPWRRALHAELLSQVSAQAPRAIGLDVLFQEPDADYPGDDAVLAQAIRASGRVVLPVVRRSQGSGDRADLPLAQLTRNASQLGHVHVNVDPDGVTRSLFLREGPGAFWPHMSIALRCAEGAALPVCRDGHLPPPSPWDKAELRIIPFATGAMPFTTYSYVDVLKGHVPADAFRDKYVLIGATATGLGDLFAAPVGPQARRVAGVELLAHMLSADLAGIRIEPAPPLWNTAFCLLPVAAALLAVLVLGPSAALMTTAGLFIATLLVAVASPVLWGWPLAPAAALAGLLLAYPLWSWRRLSAAAHFLRLEMQALHNDGLHPPQGLAVSETDRSGDFLDRQINAVDHATQHLKQLHDFVSDSLHQLPSPTFVCDGQGRVTLANAAALKYVKTLGQSQAQGVVLGDLLHGLVRTDTRLPLLPAGAASLAAAPIQQEGRDAQGRTLLMLCKPFTTTQGSVDPGWLVTLVDLTDLHEALQQRDQAMHFISHDIRAPNASILTLLEMKREYPDLVPLPDLLTRIERYARASLGMAESFVNLASAQAQTYRVAPLDLAAVLAETVDDAWALAQESGVTVALSLKAECAPCLGDRALICRAVANVVNNAIKFSPAGATVDCTLRPDAAYWVVSVLDTGPGIPAASQARIFQPFHRAHGESHPSVTGIGLGLALTQTVVQRHGGRVELSSEVGVGTEFRLFFPQGEAADGGNGALS